MLRTTGLILSSYPPKIEARGSMYLHGTARRGRSSQAVGSKLAAYIDLGTSSDRLSTTVLGVTVYRLLAMPTESSLRGREWLVSQKGARGPDVGHQKTCRQSRDACSRPIA